MQTKLQFNLKQPSINFKTTAVGLALTLGAVFVALPQAQAAQERWLKLEASPSSSEYMMLDRNSIKADKKTPDLKNAVVYVNNPTPNEKDPQSAQIDLRLNCGEKTISVLKTTLFSKADLKGQKMEETDMPENSNKLNVDSDGIDKMLYNAICK